jgi:3-oxoacyl-[acyl-carrier-protein] synthase-3
MLGVVPEKRVSFADEATNYDFQPEKMRQLAEVMGLRERRVARPSQCTSDMCQWGVEYLVGSGRLALDTVDAMLLVTQTPDHFVPPTSAVLHGKLRMPKTVGCADINDGCAGYVRGLLLGFSLLQLEGVERVLVLAGDTLSRACSPHDRAIYPLIGDAASVTLLERSDSTDQVFADLRTDGSRADWLKIPAGAFRLPPTDHTRRLRDSGDGNRRSLEQFHMNGPGIFLFTQTDVPQMLEELLAFAGVTVEEVDYFLFHQPNRFLLRKLGQRLGAGPDRLLDNLVEWYGNSSSATIPVLTCQNLATQLGGNRYRVCLGGFGVGLSWGGMVMNLGPLDFCELAEMPSDASAGREQTPHG